MNSLYTLFSLLLLCGLTTAQVGLLQHDAPRPLPPPPSHFAAARGAGSLPIGTFEQPISHNNATLGTFKQRYAWSDKHYAGPGSPIIFWTPGEVSIDYYITVEAVEQSIIASFARATGAGIIIIECRYFGDSFPYKSLSTEALQHLTVQETLLDLARFAREATLPFDRKRTSRPSKAPWIFSGCSLAGAYSAWMQSTGLGKGIFWAYHSSSGVVQSQESYYEYYWPAQRLSIPTVCRRNVELAISYLDKIFITGTEQQQHNLKAMFGLAFLANNDFANLLTKYVTWQYGPYYSFCRKIDGTDKKKSETPKTTAQEIVKRWAMLVKTEIKKGDFTCLPCYEKQNASNPQFTDQQIHSEYASNRGYKWLQCNQPLGLYATAIPGKSKPGIVSKLLTAEFYQRQCALYFPEQNGFTFGSNRGRTEVEFNNYTGGWTYPARQRIVYNNFEYDPFIDATVSARNRPGGPLTSGKDVVVHVVPEQYHCADLYVQGVPEPLKEVIEATVAQIKEWTAEYHRR